MPFIAVFTALMTAFVLIAPIAMAALLVKGSVPMRQGVPTVANASGCSCNEATCARSLALSSAA